MELIIYILLFISSIENSYSQNPSLKFENVRHGFITKVENENLRHYYLNAKIKIPKGSKLTILKDMCILLGKDEKRLSKCYVHYENGDFGFSEELIFPLDSKTFYVWGMYADNKKQEWAYKVETNSVSEEEGSITYFNRYENDLRDYQSGYIELYLLWEVPDGFIPKSIVLGKIFKLDI